MLSVAAPFNKPCYRCKVQFFIKLKLLKTLGLGKPIKELVNVNNSDIKADEISRKKLSLKLNFNSEIYF
jgi:hypothetical protein